MLERWASSQEDILTCQCRSEQVYVEGIIPLVFKDVAIQIRVIYVRKTKTTFSKNPLCATHNASTFQHEPILYT